MKLVSYYYCVYNNGVCIEPLVGDILGLETTLLNVYYTPSTFTTAEAEISFRTTEFDSQPRVARIVGSALPSKVNVQTQQLEALNNSVL